MQKLWKSIQKKAESAPAPSLIHQDLDLIARAIRDFFTADTEQVVIDSPKDHRRIVDFVRHFMPRLKSKIILYSDKEPLFEQLGIEEKITKALDPRAWLRSGGYIIIERTEALTAVDVNTGRFVGKRSQEETILKTNLEAVQEVVRQLRLRNAGGLIIIDFIDMEREANRKKVYDALREALKKDKARTNILKISELGLVEMTRQRTRESLENQLLRSCPHCDGRGRIKSPVTVAYDVLRAIKRHQPAWTTAGISSCACTRMSPTFSTTRKTTAWKISNARSTTASSSRRAKSCTTRNTRFRNRKIKKIGRKERIEHKKITTRKGGFATRLFSFSARRGCRCLYAISSGRKLRSG